MATGPCNKIGMAVSTLFCIAGLVMIIVLSINSKPGPTQITRNETTPIQTVAVFDPRNDQNSSQLVLSPETEGIWGGVPGSWNSSYIMNLTYGEFATVYDGAFVGGKKIELIGNGTHNFTVSLNLTKTKPFYSNITYGCDTCKREIVEVIPHFNYTVANENDWYMPVSTLNWGALTSWYKLAKAPMFKAAWRMLAQITDKMFTQSFQMYYYATVLEVSQLNNEVYVDANVLNSLTNTTQQDQIFNDPQYGMSSSKALTYWIGAALAYRDGQTTGSTYSDEIITHFNTDYPGMALDNTFITTVVEPGSIISDMIIALETNLTTTSGLVNATAPLTAVQVACTQWAERSLLGTQLNSYAGANLDIYTMLDMGMGFMVTPEFTGTKTFTQEECNTLLYPDPFSNSSLINTVAMYDEYFNALTNANASLMSNDQWTDFSYYMDVQLAAANMYQGEGQLMAKTVPLGLRVLNDTLLYVYSSRNMGHVINYGKGAADPQQYTCAGFVGSEGAGANATQTTTICDAYPMNTTAGVNFFTNALWYNQKTPFMNATGLTDPQYIALMDVATPGSFGAVFQSVLTDEQAKWSCAAANCTQDELVYKQYGAADITLQPIYNPGPDTLFIPSNFTICDWGGAAVTGVAGPPEVYAYLNIPYQQPTDPFILSESQIQLLMSTDYSWYGLSNNYNMMQLYTEWATSVSKGDAFSANWMATAVQLGVTDNHLIRLVISYQWQTIELTLEGLTKELTLLHMVWPYPNTYTDEINTGTMQAGNLHIDPITTANINNVYGPTALRAFEILTGVNYDKNGEKYVTPDTIGTIRDIDDGEGYIWLRYSLWDGQDWLPVMWYDELAGIKNTYDPGLPLGSQYDMKLGLQNSPQMQFQSQLSGFSLDYFTPYSLQQDNSTSVCLTPGGGCNQTAERILYSSEASSAVQQNVEASLNTPLEASAEVVFQTYDAQTGYVLGMTREVQLQLSNGDYFFLNEPFNIPNQPNPVTAQIRTYITTNTTAFYDEFYPANGTYWMPTGKTVVVDGPTGLRKPLSVVWISIATFVLAIALIGLVMFAVLFKAEKAQEEAGRPLYSNMDQNVNPSQDQHTEGERNQL